MDELDRRQVLERKRKLMQHADNAKKRGKPLEETVPVTQEMQELTIEYWDPDGKSWSEWNVRPTAAFGV